MESKKGGPGEKKPETVDQKGDAKLEQAMKDSPYVQYNDLEDYKRQGYGTEGHQKVVEDRGAGNTDAPTESGASKPEYSATHVINSQGVN